MEPNERDIEKADEILFRYNTQNDISIRDQISQGIAEYRSEIESQSAARITELEAEVSRYREALEMIRDRGTHTPTPYKALGENEIQHDPPVLNEYAKIASAALASKPDEKLEPEIGDLIVWQYCGDWHVAIMDEQRKRAFPEHGVKPILVFRRAELERRIEADR